MLIYQFHHYIKPEFVEAYKAAILENAWQTLPEEGVLRFDVFQDKEAPTHFSLLEIYTDAAARESHLQTEYFLKFRDTIIGQEMLARKGNVDEFDLLFPEGK